MIQIWVQNVVEEKSNLGGIVEDDTSNDMTSNMDPGILHQSSRVDIDKNQYGDNSMMKNVNDKFKNRAANNTVVVERNNYEEAASVNPAAEYLETYQDIEEDDDFYKITSLGTRDNLSYDIDRAQKKFQKAKQFLNIKGRSINKADYHTLAKTLLKVYRTIQKVEAVGVSLLEVFNRPKRDQKFAFKLFFINLDIWGNWETGSKRSVKKLPYQMRKNAKEKVEYAKITLERCVSLMKNNFGELHNKVLFLQE